MLNNALLVVDVQSDCSFAVDAANVATRIAKYVQEYGDDYRVVVASKLWHPADLTLFSAEPDYLTTWPPHCIRHTRGAEFHPNLRALEDTDLSYAEMLAGDWLEFDRVFYKGQSGIAYSAFEGSDCADFPTTGMKLREYLLRHQITHIDIVGFTAEYSVYKTAGDARRWDYSVSVPLELCAAIRPEELKAVARAMAKLGIETI